MKKFQEKISAKFSVREWDKAISILSSYGSGDSLQWILKEESLVLIRMSPIPYCRTYTIQFKKCDQFVELIAVELLISLKNVSPKEDHSLKDEVNDFFDTLLNEDLDN